MSLTGEEDDDDRFSWWLARSEDAYDEAATRAGIPYDLDDRPEWERHPPPPEPPRPPGEPTCRLCYTAAPLDPYQECERCRVDGRWCRWCAMERIEYTSLDLGRTCYRWLRRNEGRYDEAELERRRLRVVSRRWARKGL